MRCDRCRIHVSHLCHTSITPYLCFGDIYSLLLYYKYLNYKVLVWNASVHPGVAVPDIRMYRVARSGCWKPEDGGDSGHFCLLSALFLLVFSKEVLYVDEIISLQIHIGTFHFAFGTIPATRFNVGRWYRCDRGVIHESGIYHTSYVMFFNTYKAKCDRVIEDSGKTI